MLQSLHVKNLALIDEVCVDFSDGLNILTGETGAGKSIIIGSIGIGLGGKFDNSLLRNKDTEGLVELIFWLDKNGEDALQKADPQIAAEEGQVIIQRRLVNGRTINRINDHTVTVSKLKEISELLINLHAQHESTTLLKAKKHLMIIDSSDPAIIKEKQVFSDVYKDYKEVSDELADLDINCDERIKRLDFINFEINEIESAKLIKGEDSDLEDSFKKMNASKDILLAANEIYSATGYDKPDSMANSISRELPHLRELTRLDKDLKDIVEQLSDIDALLNDFNRSLSDYMQSMEFDERDLRDVEERLDIINSLKMKYGKSIEEIEKTCESLKAEKENLEHHDELVEELKKKRSKLKEKLDKEAEKLSNLRKNAAEKLCKKIRESLYLLNFNDVKFETCFKDLEETGVNGRDEAIFMISTNVGEDLRALNEVASGGELSRVMLAIKAALADYDDSIALVFDEIDTGISGITAQAVGKMMKELSKRRQIIAITHLPQIAAAADHSFIIEKCITDDQGTKKTVTNIREISEEGKIAEIARLLGGADITETVLNAASEMVKNYSKNS